MGFLGGIREETGSLGFGEPMGEHEGSERCQLSLLFLQTANRSFEGGFEAIVCDCRAYLMKPGVGAEPLRHVAIRF